MDLRNRLDRASTSQTPVVARFQIPLAIECVDYLEVILPLANSDAQISMLLLAAYPAV